MSGTTKVEALHVSFRGAMRRLAATVCVITVGDREHSWGMTATSVTSLTADPPAVLVCINRSASIFSHVLQRRKFCVNLLTHQHIEVSKAFSGSKRPEERFAFGTWRTREGIAPYLADAQANIFCEIKRSLSFATHEIIIGAVCDVRLCQEVAPLIYQDGHYCAAAPLSANL